MGTGMLIRVACTPTDMLPPVRFVMLNVATACRDRFKRKAVQEFQSVFNERPVVRVCLIANAREALPLRSLQSMKPGLEPFLGRLVRLARQTVDCNRMTQSFFPSFRMTDPGFVCILGNVVQHTSGHGVC